MLPELILITEGGYSNEVTFTETFVRPSQRPERNLFKDLVYMPCKTRILTSVDPLKEPLQESPVDDINHVGFRVWGLGFGV